MSAHWRLRIRRAKQAPPHLSSSTNTLVSRYTLQCCTTEPTTVTQFGVHYFEHTHVQCTQTGGLLKETFYMTIRPRDYLLRSPFDIPDGWRDTSVERTEDRTMTSGSCRCPGICCRRVDWFRRRQNPAATQSEPCSAIESQRALSDPSLRCSVLLLGHPSCNELCRRRSKISPENNPKWAPFCILFCSVRRLSIYFSTR